MPPNGTRPVWYCYWRCRFLAQQLSTKRRFLFESTEWLARTCCRAAYEFWNLKRFSRFEKMLFDYSWPDLKAEVTWNEIYPRIWQMDSKKATHLLKVWECSSNSITCQLTVVVASSCPEMWLSQQFYRQKIWFPCAIKEVIFLFRTRLLSVVVRWPKNGEISCNSNLIAAITSTKETKFAANRSFPPISSSISLFLLIGFEYVSKSSEHLSHFSLCRDTKASIVSPD